MKNLFVEPPISFRRVDFRLKPRKADLLKRELQWFEGSVPSNIDIKRCQWSMERNTVPLEVRKIGKKSLIRNPLSTIAKREPP